MDLSFQNQQPSQSRLFHRLGLGNIWKLELLCSGTELFVELMTAMLKTLCIAIPTYNRAHLLDAQFAWVAAATQGLEGRVELI